MCLDILNCECRFTFDNFIVVFCQLTFTLNLIQRGGFGQIQADFFTFVQEVFNRSFQMLDALEEETYIQLTVGLFSGLIDFPAIIPWRLAASQYFYPVITHIFHIFEKVKVLCLQFMTFIIIVESSLGHHNLVSILIERHHEKSKEGNNDSEQSSQIRQHIINLADIPLQNSLFLREGDHEGKQRIKVRYWIGSIRSIINKIPFIFCDGRPRQPALIGLNFKLRQLNNDFSGCAHTKGTTDVLQIIEHRIKLSRAQTCIQDHQNSLQIVHLHKPRLKSIIKVLTPRIHVALRHLNQNNSILPGKKSILNEHILPLHRAQRLINIILIEYSLIFRTQSSPILQSTKLQLYLLIVEIKLKVNGLFSLNIRFKREVVFEFIIEGISKTNSKKNIIYRCF